MPKPRKINTRKIKERILILCEGEKTEPNYFKGIKADKGLEDQLTALRIEVSDTIYNTALELVKQAVVLSEEARRERNPYDSIWVVIDKDGYQKHPEAFDLAEGHRIRIAFSSISFEYWFLLHFAQIAITFDRSHDLESYLREKGFYRGYKKSHNHYQHLKKHTQTAIENAAWLREEIGYNPNVPKYNYNPYTDVDELVTYLMAL